MSQVTEQSVRFQTALASIKLIQASAVLDLTEDDFDFLTSNKVWIVMTRKVSAEVDLVHQQTQNQRYGSSHIGATAKDISNVVTDAASGVVDIFHGIDKAVADTWNNFWKDGKADGIG